MNDEVIRCENLSKAYGSGETRVHALKDASLAVKAGEFVALKGPSGSGKSTLLNICGLLDTADAGGYYFRGDTCHDSSTRTLLRRKNIGFVFQNFNLMAAMNAYENIEYPLLLSGTAARERRKVVMDALEAVGMADHWRRLPDKLSGGQRQRVTIARALVKKPALVIADEPTANLDSATAESIVELMKKLSHENRAAFLIATHDDRMSAHCDRIVTMVDGRVAI